MGHFSSCHPFLMVGSLFFVAFALVACLLSMVFAVSVVIVFGELGGSRSVAELASLQTHGSGSKGVFVVCAVLSAGVYLEAMA